MKKGCEGKAKSGKRAELPVLENGMRPSRNAKWRAIALISLTILMAIHVIQWRIMGTTVSPIEPSEAMYTLQQGAINAGFIFFTIAILATLIFGRFVCGWGCHIVALQDLCGWAMKKIGITPKPFRSRLLIYVPLIVALYMFVWPTVGRYLTKPANEPLFPAFTNHLIVTDFWATFPPVWVAVPFLFVCGFMTVYFLGQKGFCTYACPYGGFFGVADKIAPGKIRVTDACNQCGHCTATCTSNVVVHAEVKQFGMVVDPGCMKCFDCISVCPNDALYYGFGKPSVAVRGSRKKSYSLTWPEDLFAAAVFAASYFAVWNVYQLVPMLMALGIATVTTFVSIKTLQMFRLPDATFHKFKLRTAGKLRSAGWLFLAFSIPWIALIVHSGYVRYHERAGNEAFNSVKIPDELALAEPDPRQWLGPDEQASIAAGSSHFDKATRVSLFTNTDALSKIGWLEYLSGDTSSAINTLQRAAERNAGQARALSLYYRGAILNRAGRHEEALPSLDAAIIERPDLAPAREEKGEALWLLGRRDLAVAAWEDALRANERLPLANNFLAGASAALGGDPTTYESQADAATPNDPYFHWMLALRLRGVGMNSLAEKHFAAAIKLDPSFRARRN